ncbi:MAG: choice-of-anchor B domain-containing protein [Paraglaciecola sp.]|jgi:choice-of-anchor B domain-containing protein
MRIVLSSIMLLAISISHDTLAHAEHDKARFVAVNGEDQGLCNNRFRPCSTITYAAQQASKGDKILVAQGQYTIKSEEDFFYLVGQIVPVHGGYNQIDNYQGQNPDVYLTSITGVPVEYAEQMNQQGFKIVRDLKGQTQSLEFAENASFSQLKTMQSRQSATACINGLSGGFPCHNMSLLAHIPLADLPGSPSTANDIWGHYDLNTNKEYAIVGQRNGISVVDVSAPEEPLIVGNISGISSTWRDIKVYQFFDPPSNRWRAYAYATTEGNEGLTIIDLSNLPNDIALVTRQLTDRTAHNIYISNVDYGLNIALPDTTPLLHIAGSGNFGGALRSYSLADPEILGTTYSPSFALPTGDYTHDASSLVVTDSRAQSDCTQATESGCVVILDFNEKELRVWDHSNINQSLELSATTYPNAEYTHSGWWSEDKKYVIVHDELDEQRRSLNTTLNIFDISSLTQPQLAGTWTGPTRAIDHNGFVRGNRYYMSNYERGMTVLDISDPANPSEVGYFDTFPVSDNAAFNGAWGVYPFLPSGTILVSDINSGLYILKDETLQSDMGSISINQRNLVANEGDTVSIEVNKSTQGIASVAYEILPGSATQEDYMVQTGELNWITDDNLTKVIELQINSDALEEPDEVFFLRLFDPRNGATLSSPSIMQIEIAGIASRGLVNFTQQEIILKETDTNATVEVSRVAGTDEAISVDYQLLSGTAQIGEDAGALSGTLTWQDGDADNKSIEINLINDALSEGLESLQLVLNSDDPALLGSQAETTITIRDDESNQPPSANAGSDLQVNTRQSAVLNGSGEDPEQYPLTYQWQQISGISVNITNANNAQASFTAPSTAGTLEFNFTVTDDFDISTSDVITITVMQAATTTPPGGSGGSLCSLLLLFTLGCLRYRKRYVN